jgi:hypothetical protein
MKYQKEFEEAMQELYPKYPEGFLLDHQCLFEHFFLAGVQAAEPTSKTKELPALLKPKNKP